MSRLLRLLLPLLALIGASVLSAVPPAAAVGTASPVVTAPTAGQQVESGWSGPVTIDFANAPVDDYEVYVEPQSSSSDYWFSRSIYYSGSQDVVSFQVTPVTEPGSYTISVYGSQGAYASRSFTVVAPPLPAMNVDNASIAPATFYPLVRDGYRDTTKLTFRLNQAAHVKATVRNSNGGTTRTVDLGTKSAGTRSWSWDGRRNDGTRVGTGKYSVSVKATNADGSSDSVARTATVATGTVTRSATKSKWGDQGSPSTRGNCQITKDTYEGTATLDCWGGRYAQMSYGFDIPASATNVRWAVRGGTTGLDICCQGKITKSGTRTSSRRYVVRAKVTSWRAYDVYRARITYSYKKRI